MVSLFEIGGPPHSAELLAEAGVLATPDLDDMVTAVERVLGTMPTAAERWPRRLRILPPPIVSFLRASVRVDAVREAVLVAAEDDLLTGVAEQQRDVAAIEEVWRRVCRADRLLGTLRWLRGLRDDVVRSYHGGACYQHPRPKQLPPILSKWRPCAGVLVVDDPSTKAPSLGYPAYLEQTPPQVVRYVFEKWRRRWLNETREVHGKRKPGVWDLFAGSGTTTDVLCGFFGSVVVATDLTPSNEAVATLDARDLGALYGHGGVSRAALRMLQQRTDSPVVRSPDIIFLDPPSRGSPTPSEVYISQWPARDLALLARNEWVATVAELAARSVQRVDPLGVVSLLIRAGTRDRQRVEGDPALVNDVKDALRGAVKVIDQVRIEFRARVRQASVATMRVPATHLLLARPR